MKNYMRFDMLHLAIMIHWIPCIIIDYILLYIDYNYESRHYDSLHLRITQFTAGSYFEYYNALAAYFNY